MIGVAVGLIAASGASAAMAAVPGVTSEGTAPPKVKPAQIVYTGDGSGLFAGAQRVSKKNLGSIQWTKWNKKKALGSGANWLNDCKPNCAKGTYHGYAVTLKLTRPRHKSGFFVFTRMLVTYTGKLPKGVSTSRQTRTLVDHNNFFVWKFPSI